MAPVENIYVKEQTTNTWNIIKEIALTGFQEEAFYVCDLGDIVNRYKEWTVKLPRVVPHYAVKCNDAPVICKTLAALGASFDCASKSEINRILDLGVSSDRIIFANPCKPVSHVRYAEKCNVDLMTFDNESELHKVQAVFPTARLILRIRCDAAVAQCPLGMKFGCDPEKDAPRLLRKAQELNLNIVGISFHVGSGCGDPPVFRRAISTARTLFDFGATLGFEMNILDIGGGFPGNKGTSIDKIADIVNNALEDFFPSPDIHIIAEPGRFMAAACYTLATNIHSKRIVSSDSGLHYMYYINDGVYGSFNAILYDHANVTPIPLAAPLGKLHPSSVWGPTCDSLDQVCDNVLLPEMHVGDWIIFEDMGAYTLPVASPFNGFPVPSVHVIADEAIWQLLQHRLPLTPEDFIVPNTSCSDEMNCSDNTQDISTCQTVVARKSSVILHEICNLVHS